MQTSIVLFETGFQDPPEKGEAGEPWGVLVGVLEVAPLAAERKTRYPLRRSSPTRSRRCRLPGRSSTGRRRTRYQQTQRNQRQHQQERHQKVRHEQERREQSRKQGAQPYAKRQHQRDARCMLSTCVHARKRFHDPLRMPVRSRSAHAKATEINVHLARKLAVLLKLLNNCRNN